MSNTLQFLGWDRPLAKAAADWLWADPERLRRRLVVVPTRESGRRLRQLLVERASQDGTPAVLGPRMATPDDFFRPADAMPESVRFAGWVRVLGACTDEEVSAVFPGGLGGKQDAWRSSVARQIEQARELLAAGNTTFADAARELEQERERWTQLAALEQKVVSAWKAWGYADPIAAKRQRAASPQLPAGCTELVVVGVPDPTWLAVSAWQLLLERGVPITLLIGAPESLRSAFDAWGRPVPGFWTDRNQFAVPTATAMHVAADSFGLAEIAVQACDGHSSNSVGLGLCDPAFLPAIIRRFAAAGWPAYDPQPAPAATAGWPEFLERLATALERPDHYVSLSALARHPLIWQRAATDWSPCATLRELDEWEREACPCDTGRAVGALKAATEPGRQAAGAWLGQVAALVKGSGAERERRIRNWILDAAARNPEVADVLAAEIEAWDCLKSIPLPLRLRWLAAAAGTVTNSPDPEPNAIPLQGWLELLFEPAPHLVLTAAHEGHLPEAPASNPLVSDVVRERFQLRDRRSRLARDLFLYAAMVHARQAGGSVTIVNAQVDPAGEPCKPSRVLLHTSLDQLPATVTQLVKAEADLPLEATPAWERGGWALRPGPDTRRNRDWPHLSPTALKSYLACPTRFYFERVLGWERLEPFDEELDGKTFGTLFHTVLERWAKEQAPCPQTDPDKLRTLWLALLDETVKQQFGDHRPPLLQLQFMSARERLVALAPVQAGFAAEGWQVIETEKELTGIISLAGIPLKVRVDRIDRHPDGRVRVLDYKTARTGIAPRTAHLRNFNPEKHPTPLGPLVGRNGNQVWVDLQLPLYAMVVGKALKLEQMPEVGYIQLPEAVSEIRFAPFEGLEECLESAHQWAETAAQRIRDGVFWPPAPEPPFDNFASLAPDGLQTALGAPWAEFLSKR